MGALTEREAGRMSQIIPWSFEPAGLQATLNNSLKGRGHVCPARLPRPGFLLAEGGSIVSPRRYRPETRLVHSGILRSQFQENAEALYLTQSYVYDSAASAEARFKGSEPGYIYSRYGNPDPVDVRNPHGGVRGRRGRARHRHRHGRGHACADGPGARRRPRGGREGACSAPAATWWRTICRATASPPPWSTAPTSRNGATRCGRTPAPSFWKRRPIRHWRSSTSRRSRRSPTRPARRWSSTTCSRRRCGRARSRSAPIASSIRRPSISTDRAAASAASSSPPRSSSRRTSIC